jgi:hypothetical protein
LIDFSGPAHSRRPASTSSSSIACRRRENAGWIPFKGGQEAGLALLGGHIDVAVITPRSNLAEQPGKMCEKQKLAPGFRILQSGRPDRITRALDSIGF